MFRKGRVVFIALLIFLSVGSVGAQNLVPFQNPAQGYTIQYPSNWQQASQNMNGMDVTYFLAPPETPQDIFRENLNIIIYPLQQQMNLDAFVSAYTQQSQTQMPNLQTVQSQNIMISNQPAKIVLYTATMQQVNMALMVLFVMNQSKAYVSTCTIEMTKFQQYQPIFSQILSSFTFVAPQFQQQPLLPQQQTPLLPQQQTPQQTLPPFFNQNTPQQNQSQGDGTLPQFN
ncbi:MAG: PsbP-related protein [Candidatus Atribacteria bacterium]|nr:PsbP-related protein [Candidatus Atribacteria bacterium]